MTSARQPSARNWWASALAQAARPVRVPPLAGHLIAVVASSLTLLFLLEFGSEGGTEVVLLPFAIAITIASFAGGFWPGLTATVIAVLGANYFLLAPLHDLRVASGRDQLHVLMLVITGLTICVLNERSFRSASAAQAAQKSLLESEQTFRTMANSIPLLAWMAEPDGSPFWLNARWTEYTGKSVQDLLASGPQSVHHPDQWAHYEAEWQQCFQRGAPFELEYLLLSSDGTYRDFLTRVFPLLDDDGRVQRWFGTNTDIDDIRRASAEKLATTARIAEQAALLDQTRDAIVLRASDDTVIYWNKGAERLYGWSASEAIGKSMVTLLSPDSPTFDKAVLALRQQGHWKGEIRKLAKDGHSLVLDARWTVIDDTNSRILSIDTDISEQKQLEEQFNRTQRQESIGKLAGGIAHDLNNVFQPILMAVAVLSEAGLDSDNRTLLDLIGASSRRGTDMVRQILSFSRGVSGERKLLDLTGIMKEVEHIVCETFLHQYDIDFEVADGLWMVTGDATQLHQVLLNLCVNARDAMPTGGRLNVRAVNIRMGGEFISEVVGLPEGNYVLISVSDTGIGMDRNTITAIFDPFFSTKPLSEGTGLGLSTALSIINSHSGFIRVYSEPGHGSTFKIFLPQGSTGVETAAPEIETERVPGRGELILVVDDERNIQEAARHVLEKFGYRVEVAEGGEAALVAIHGRANEFSAVLTDIHMPGMSGRILMTALQHDYADLPIIAMSGFDDGMASDNFKSFGASAFLGKPFSVDILLQTLRRAIDRKLDKQRDSDRAGRL